MKQKPENNLYQHLKSQYDSNAVSLVYAQNDRAKLNNILPIDSHQANAVLFAIQQPVGLIYGPPGTGKTNTLVNLAAELLSNKKQVLILTKKQEPAKIIREKLAQMGLDDVILDLSNHDISAKNLLNKLKVQFDKNYKALTTDISLPKIHETLSSIDNQLSYYEIVSPETSLTVEQMVNVVAEFYTHFNNHNIKLPNFGNAYTKEGIKHLEQQVSQFPTSLMPETDILLGFFSAPVLSKPDRLLAALTTLQNAGNILNKILPNLVRRFSFSELIALYKALNAAKIDSSIKWKHLFEQQKYIYALFNSEKHIQTIETHWRNLVFDSFWAVPPKLIKRYFSSNKLSQAFQFDNRKTIQQHFRVPLSAISSIQATALLKALEQYLYLNEQQIQIESLTGFATTQFNVEAVVSVFNKLKGMSTEQFAVFPLDADKLSQTNLDALFSKLNECPKEVIDNLAIITVSQLLTCTKPVITSPKQIQKYLQKREVISKISPPSFANVKTILEQLHNKSDVTKLLTLMRYQLALCEIQSQYRLDFEFLEQKRSLLSKKAELEKAKQLHTQQTLNTQYSGLSTKLTTHENLSLRKLLSEKKLEKDSSEILALLTAQIKKLCPITLVTPESLQRLKVSQGKFDFLIIDEASQLHLPEVLPAMNICQQMTLFGDDKQMPPTSFFKADTSNTENSDSMLSICYRYAAPSVMLKNHYRSQHNDLISFSNKTFYQEQLVTKQLTSNELEGVIIKQHQGCYQPKPGAINTTEAHHIVQRLTTISRQHKPMTVAIITSNTAQMTLLNEQLRLSRKNDHTLDQWLKSAELNAPLIVGNLDNIQGKERELVIVSFVYGWQKNNKLKQQFGLFSQYGGERRLNVLLTRASKRLEWFCNFSAADLKVTNNTPLGIKTLKDFLLEYGAKAPITKTNTKLASTSQLSQLSEPVKNVAQLHHCDNPSI